MFIGETITREVGTFLKEGSNTSKNFRSMVRDIVILVPSRHEKERVACAAKGKRMRAFFCLCGQADGKTLCVSPSQNDAKFSETRYEKVWSSFSKLASQGPRPCRPPQWAKLSYKSKFVFFIIL